MNRTVLIIWNVILSLWATFLLMRLDSLEQRMTDIASRLEVRLDYLTSVVGENSELLELLRDIVYDIHVAG